MTPTTAVKVCRCGAKRQARPRTTKVRACLGKPSSLPARQLIGVRASSWVRRPSGSLSRSPSADVGRQPRAVDLAVLTHIWSFQIIGGSPLKADSGSSNHSSPGVEEPLSPGLFAFEGARWRCLATRQTTRTATSTRCGYGCRASCTPVFPDWRPSSRGSTPTASRCSSGPRASRSLSDSLGCCERRACTSSCSTLRTMRKKPH